MESFWEALLKLIPFSQLLEDLGLNKELSTGLSVAIIALLGFTATKIFNHLIIRYKVAVAAKDLHPYFNYENLKNYRKKFVHTRFQKDIPIEEDYKSIIYDDIDGNTKKKRPKRLIPYFTKQAFNDKRNTGQYFIVLGGSGMGKTTFLVNLYLKYVSFKNINKKYDIKYYPFSDPSILDKIKRINNDEEKAKKTILLLDAFDEYDKIIPSDKPDGLSDDERFRKQLDEICINSRYCRKVVITSRAQLFPGQLEETYQIRIKSYDDTGYHSLTRLYLSPFDEISINKFLNKKYGRFNIRYKKKKKQARKIIEEAPDLMMRPLLLSYIGYLIDTNGVFYKTYEIYDALVDRWIDGESKKGKFSVAERETFKQNLKKYSKLVALEIYAQRKVSGELFLGKKEALRVANLNSIDLKNYELTGQSLLTRVHDNWKFAHKTIFEYFIARHAFENPSFALSVNFTGLDDARIFYNELTGNIEAEEWCREHIPPNSNRYADIHCHPHMRSFNLLQKPWNPSKSEKYHPWWIIPPYFKNSANSIRALAYSHCDLAQIINGNLKLAIVSLYSLEKGWVTGRKSQIKGRPIDLKKLLGDNDFNDAVSGGISALVKPVFNFMGKDKGGDPALRDFLLAIFMKLPVRKINFFQSGKYDYFKELISQHDYLLRKNNVETQTEIFIPPVKKAFALKRQIKYLCPLELNAIGTYVIASNGQHAKDIIEQGKTAFILAIEGAHVFNSHEPVEEVKKKIMEVKSWEESLFFITFTHHFYNYLAGHAHSIPDVGTNLIDQDEGVNEGFTDSGREIIRLLLSIDKDNNKVENLGRRVLIDVKHLSVVARKEFYDEIIKPCYNKGDIIPIIASHVAYSGVEKLGTLIMNLNKEKDGVMVERFGYNFNCWSINICDEDVIIIFKTGGLIGISLDQQMLGIKDFPRSTANSPIRNIWQNIRAIIMAIIESRDTNMPDKKKVTELICIGSDFGGNNNPMMKYECTLDFTQLRDDLVTTIDNDPEKDKFLFGLTPEQLVEKICFTNAMDFVLKNFK